MEESVKEEDFEYIPGYNSDGIVGYVTNVVSPGYGGDIVFVLGFNIDGVITGINIIESKETPGLGAKISNESWQDKWKGRTDDYEFDKKVDAFAGATISPLAVYTGIKEALSVYEQKVKMDEEEIKMSDIRKEVLPGANNFKIEKAIKKEEFKYIPGYDGSKKVGYVTEVSSEGHQGEIVFALGFDLDGKVTGIIIIESEESAGIGDKIEDPEWLNKWKGITKDYEYDHEVDAVAGATVSQKAVLSGLKKALTIYDKEVKANE